MKKVITFICLCLFITIFAFMFVFSVFLPRTTASHYDTLTEKPEFTFKALFSGEYFDGMMSYFTDTIHGRDTFIDFESRIRSLYGLEKEQELIVIKPDEVDPDADKSSEDKENVSDTSSEAESETAPEDSSVDTSVESTPESSFTPDESESSEVSTEESESKLDAEISGSVLLVGNRALELYYGNTEGAKNYANILNEFADKLDPSVNVYSMVIPKSSAYYLEQANGYDNLIYRNKDNIELIGETLSDRVIDVNIYNILGQHANEEIYFRTDHHWTALGAYYASSVFASKAGIAFDELDEFEAVTLENFLGTMYTFSGKSPVLLNNPENFTYYKPNTDYTVTYYSPTDLTSSPKSHDGGFFWSYSNKSMYYYTFIQGDSFSVKAVSNECKNGRKLLIVKDSYGNALAPFMMEGFEEIYIVDARSYKNTLRDTIDKFGITDVLFAECTFSAVGSGYLSDLKEICK